MHALERPIFDHAGLRVAVSPQGDAVVTVTGPHPHAAHIVPEAATRLAFDLLGAFAPDVLVVVQRAVRRERIRLVVGGPEPEDAA